MKLAGLIFIVLSAGSVGIRISASLRKRCRLIRQLLSAVQVMNSEIGCCCTPLPQTFALMAVAVNGSAARVFSVTARLMDKNRWMPPIKAMEQALQNERELGEDKELSEVLLALAAGLGKYDKESQLQILDRTKVRLEEILASAEKECSMRSKTYEVLGICTGISLAILLI